MLTWFHSSYSCKCPDGWTRNPVTQVCGGDICNPAIRTTCPRFAECALTPYDNHRCRCVPGIRWNSEGTCGETDNRERCKIGQDDDGCDSRKGQTCIPGHDGNPICGCAWPATQVYGRHRALVTDGSTLGRFEDPASGICLVDECATGSHDCDRYAQCTDLVDGFLCQCGPGYLDESVDQANKPGRYCKPKIDECRENRHNCSSFAECIDTDASYICRCPAGYVDLSPNTATQPGKEGSLVWRCLINITSSRGHG